MTGLTPAADRAVTELRRHLAALRNAEPVDHQPDHQPTTDGTERVAPVRAALAEKRADTEETT